MPSFAVERTPTAANASLISTASRSAGGNAGALQCGQDGVGRLLVQQHVRTRDQGMGDDLGNRRDAQALGGGLADQHHRGGAVGDLRGVARGDGAVPC